MVADLGCLGCAFKSGNSRLLSVCNLVGQAVCGAAYNASDRTFSRRKHELRFPVARFDLLCTVSFAVSGRRKSLRMNAVRRTPGEESREEESAGCNSYLLHAIHLAPQSRWAGTTHELVWARNRAQNRGRSSPTQSFARAQIGASVVRKFF